MKLVIFKSPLKLSNQIGTKLWKLHDFVKIRPI